MTKRNSWKPAGPFRFLLLGAAISILSSCASQGIPPARNAGEAACRVAGLSTGECDPSDLRDVEIRESRIEAVSLTVGARIPPLEAVVARAIDDHWVPTLFDKVVALKGLEAVLTSQGQSASPEALAELTARLGVDPDLRNGIVVRSSGDIPSDRDSSDVVRDLRRQGFSAEAIRARLVPEGVADKCGPPTFEREGVVALCTWAYYDGALVRWRIDLRKRVAISRRLLAEHVGSYKLLM